MPRRPTEEIPRAKWNALLVGAHSEDDVGRLLQQVSKQLPQLGVIPHSAATAREASKLTELALQKTPLSFVIIHASLDGQVNGGTNFHNRHLSGRFELPVLFASKHTTSANIIEFASAILETRAQRKPRS